MGATMNITSSLIILLLVLVLPCSEQDKQYLFIILIFLKVFSNGNGQEKVR